MRVIVYQNEGGGICVVHPVRSRGDEAMSDGEVESRAMAQVTVDGAIFMSADALPTARTFRNAWILDGSTIAIDMGVAREIHRANLRTLRAPLLAAADIAYMRADEAGDVTLKAQIAARKQALRDATNDPSIEAASTPDELKAAIPLVLRVE